MTEIQKLTWRCRPGANFCADGVYPIHYLFIEVTVFTQGVINTLTPFNKTGQNIVDIVDGKSIIRFVFCAGTFGPRTITVPDFALAIPLAHKQHIFTMRATGD